MRAFVIAGTTAALVTALAVPSLATDERAGNGTVIRYQSTNPDNTDIDLGAPGLSPGDRQVFTSQAVRDGKQIGYEAGEAVIVEVTKKGLKASLTVTLVLTGGTLTVQGLFVEDFAQGPRGLTLAVTGGTGRYRGASGESVGEFIPNTDTVKTTIRLK